MGKWFSKKRFSVSGQLGGFNSTLQYFPGQKFGVVMLSNWISAWGNLAYPARQIVDLYLEAHLEKIASPSPASTSKTKEFKPDPDRYDQYAGDYRWSPGFVVNVFREKNKKGARQEKKKKFSHEVTRKDTKLHSLFLASK